MLVDEVLNTISLESLYQDNYPDQDELFWEYVRPRDLKKPLEIHVMPRHRLLIMLLSQYRVEHIDEIKDMLEPQQKSIVKGYMKQQNLQNEIIVIADDRIVDGNHRALAAAIKGVSIKYVDLSELQ